MAETAPRMPLSQNEAAALGVAVLGHVALVAALVWLKPADLPPPPPERMSVTISDETGLVSTSPDPQADPVQDSGPVVGDMAPPPLPEPVEVAQAQPRPVPAPAARPLVQPKVQPQTKPAQRPPIQPPRNQSPPRPGTKPGNSRFADAFGDGIPQGNPAGKGKTPPAQAQGAAVTSEVRSALASSITRQLKPRWRGRAPQGLDADKLVTFLTWDLNPDGTMAGSPRVVRQEGITPANRAQAARHAEEAIKAVKLVGKFDLPPQYYSAWKHIASFRFDRSLGQ
ncbi:hypothetical protein [Novosphingobium sp.]|uniref:hypothetical protein n=1 Tax=Novosphingobium sp. TaxID=1874826 RepID=UPI00286CDAAE|nr:hypothetical protein [Novosphingobium sp.]